MDGLAHKVYSQIGDQTEELIAKRLGDKYRSPKGPSGKEMKDAEARSTPAPNGDQVADYTKFPDGSFAVKWKSGAITHEGQDWEPTLHSQVDMSTYARDVASRKAAGEHPAMRDPSEVAGTAESMAKSKQLVADHDTTASTAPADDEEELLARAGK